MIIYSAGVTTGPVTVPFVLSLGLSFGKVVDAPQGFGILACASVAPIISGMYILHSSRRLLTNDRFTIVLICDVYVRIRLYMINRQVTRL